MLYCCRYGDWQYHYVGRPALGYWSGGWGGYGPNYWGNSYYPGAQPAPAHRSIMHPGSPNLCSGCSGAHPGCQELLGKAGMALASSAARGVQAGGSRTCTGMHRSTSPMPETASEASRMGCHQDGKPLACLISMHAQAACFCSLAQSPSFPSKAEAGSSPGLMWGDWCRLRRRHSHIRPKQCVSVVFP